MYYYNSTFCAPCARQNLSYERNNMCVIQATILVVIFYSFSCAVHLNPVPFCSDIRLTNKESRSLILGPYFRYIDSS
jgi:hypothetical protein